MRALAVVAGAWLISGCGRIAFDPITRAPDAFTAADVAPSDCWAAWTSGAPQFSSLRRIDELDSAMDEADPSPTSDALALYFTLGPHGANTQQLYVARRASRMATFDPAAEVTELAGTIETKIAFTPDTLDAVISAGYPGGLGNEDLWETTRGDAGAKFSIPSETSFAVVNDNRHQLDPWLSADGLRLYFAILVVGSTSQSLAMTARPSRGAAFAAPAPVVLTNPLTYTADPALTPDELTLVYSTENVPGNQHLAIAQRTTTADAFVSLGPLTVLNGSARDGDVSLTVDGCEVFFASTRTTGVDYDLYVADVVPQ